MTPKFRARYNMSHNVAGLLFAFVGTAWWLIPMIMSGGHHGHEMESMTHGPTFLAFDEMTWMWYVMAVAHFFINDSICPSCCNKDD